MKITKQQLRRIIKESMSDADAAQEAGYNDAMRNRPHGSNPDMRDLDPRAYDYGFDKGTADRMDMQRPSGTGGFYEGKINERGTGNPALANEERALTSAVVQWVDKYRMVMAMDPSDPGNDRRVRRVLDDLISGLMQ